MRYTNALFAAAAIAASTPSQNCPAPSLQGWTATTGLTTIPSVRRSGAMCFDGNGNRLILYGGVSPTPSLILNETWAFNGTTWTQLQPLGGALGRWGHQMVRNTVMNRLVTFGGRSPTISGFANDSYQWNGTVWSDVPASNPPPARYLYGMAYDSGRDKIVLFGGRGTLDTLGDTWELTNNGATWSWQLIQPTTSPPPREEMVMAYSPELRRTILFGGYDRDTDTIYGDTWEYDGTTWHAVTPANSPTPRYRMASGYDTVRRRLTIYGGFDGNAVLTQTYEYTGLTTTPPMQTATVWEPNWQLISVGPGGTHATEMYAAYDSTRRKFYTFGGASAGGFSNQTHEYNASCTAIFSQFGVGCPTSVGIATVSPADPDGEQGPLPPSLPRLGQTYTMQFANLPTVGFIFVIVGLSNTSLSGIPLPIDLSILGLVGCHLHTSNEVLQALLIPPSGLVTFNVPIPPPPGGNVFLNMPLYSQALIFDALAPNGAGGTSRGGVGVIGN